VLGLAVNAVGLALGITPELIADIGAAVMIAFGLVLLVPQLSERFATATAGVSAGADARLDQMDTSGYRGQFLTGLLLGAVWVPCIGPTLGIAISLASQGESLARAGLIMTFFALGVSTIILALGYGARSVIQKRQAWMRAMATKARPIMGAVFLVVGVGLLLRVHHYLEFLAIQYLPAWLIDLSVSL
jgi:cytochrome c biogenesis protein CcdA